MAKAKYVNNDDLRDEILVYKNMCMKEKEKYAQSKGLEIDDPESGQYKRPQMQDKLGIMILEIGERFSMSPKFKGYTYREEMVSDGICNIIKYIENYDPDKSKNAFAYLTQIFYYAFLARIKSEKKEMFITYKMNDKAGNHLGHDFGDNPFESWDEKLRRTYGISENDVKNFEEETGKKERKKREPVIENDIEDYL